MAGPGSVAGPSQQCTVYAPNLRCDWLDFVMLDPERRILICAVPKNGDFAVETALAIATRTKFEWFSHAATAKHLHMNATAVRELFDQPSWRRAVIHRDPVERFVSAFKSKCLMRDAIDGRANCHDVFQLTDSSVNIRAVAQRLPAFGHTNPHWAPQSHFCGGAVGQLWAKFTDHIPTSNVTHALPALFVSRLPPLVLRQMARALDPQRSANAQHATRAGGADMDQLQSDVRDAVAAYYSADYELMASHGWATPTSSTAQGASHSPATSSPSQATTLDTPYAPPAHMHDRVCACPCMTARLSPIGRFTRSPISHAAHTRSGAAESICNQSGSL